MSEQPRPLEVEEAERVLREAFASASRRNTRRALRRKIGHLPGVTIHERAEALSRFVSEATQDEIIAHSQMEEVVGDLDPMTRDCVLDGIHELLKRKQKSQDESAAEMRARLASYEDAVAWWQSNPLAALERNEHTRLDKLKDALSGGRIHMVRFDPGDDVEPQARALLQKIEHTFVVKHDWAAAFEGAKIDGSGAEEIRLPYDLCSFEFRVAGRTIIAVAMTNPEDEAEHKAIAFVECSGGYWSPFSLNHPDPVSALLDSEIRAIAIALDAEVAVHEVVRAPAKLNEKRARAGKTKLPDHYVIDLARRHRIANPSSGRGEGPKRRLHFRRGHWRHYPSHRTWIKWMLVGDPDLGFVDKHYAL